MITERMEDFVNDLITESQRQEYSRKVPSAPQVRLMKTYHSLDLLSINEYNNSTQAQVFGSLFIGIY